MNILNTNYYIIIFSKFNYCKYNFCNGIKLFKNDRYRKKKGHALQF